MTAQRIAWRAEKEGEAHAHLGRGRVLRTACGKPAIDERHAWPAEERCQACATAIERLTPANGSVA